MCPLQRGAGTNPDTAERASFFMTGLQNTPLWADMNLQDNGLKMIYQVLVHLNEYFAREMEVCKLLMQTFFFFFSRDKCALRLFCTTAETHILIPGIGTYRQLLMCIAGQGEAIKGIF